MKGSSHQLKRGDLGTPLTKQEDEIMTRVLVYLRV